MSGEDLGKYAPEGAAGWKGYGSTEEVAAQNRDANVRMRQLQADVHNAERPLAEKLTFRGKVSEKDVAQAEAEQVDKNFESHKRWEEQQAAEVQERKEKSAAAYKEKLQTELQELKEKLETRAKELKDIAREREDGLRNNRHLNTDVSNGDIRTRSTGFLEGLQEKEDAAIKESLSLEKQIAELTGKIESLENPK